MKIDIGPCLAIILLIVALRVIFLRKARRDQMPTDQEVNQELDHLNRKHIERNNP